jgi:hypothetical protein
MTVHTKHYVLLHGSPNHPYDNTSSDTMVCAVDRGVDVLSERVDGVETRHFPTTFVNQAEPEPILNRYYCLFDHALRQALQFHDAAPRGVSPGGTARGCWRGRKQCTAQPWGSTQVRTGMHHA